MSNVQHKTRPHVVFAQCPARTGPDERQRRPDRDRRDRREADEAFAASIAEDARAWSRLR